MERINLNHWYVGGNDLYISLMRFYVRISIENNGCQLEVVDQNRRNIILKFDTLEDAISFTENVVNKCSEIAEIRDDYKEFFGKTEVLPELKVDPNDPSKVLLTEEDIYKLIVSYYGKGRKDIVDAKKEMGISDHQIDLHFYLIEYFEGKEFDTMLTEGDLSNVFSDYLDPYGKDLVDFKYMGNIRRVGYFTDEDKPIFQGVQLNTKEKVKTRK